MEGVVSRLVELDANSGALLVIAGILCGLAGWRIIRYIAVMDALAAAVLLAIVSLDQVQQGVAYLPIWPAAVVLAFGLPWLAWRHPRWAVISVSGVVAFLLVQSFLIDHDVPPLAGVLLGSVACGIAMAMHVSLYRETSVIVTGLHGGWLCVGALISLGAGSGGFAGELVGQIFTYPSLLPIIAMSLSAIMISVQWADMERCVEPTI